MTKYQIEVGGELDRMINDGAKKSGLSAEKFITHILSRYLISPHILDSEDIKKAYTDCGDINLEWANL